jgi:lysylphosphatidylglycerol synthetase-like protein (DUF2156 family)
MLAGAMAVGFAVHLNADLFPAAWILPLGGQLGAWSFPWLLINSFLLLIIAHLIFHNPYDRALMRTYYVCVLTVGTVYTLRDRAHWVPLVVFFLTWSAAIATSRKIVELEPRLLRQQKQVTQDL